MNVVRDLKGGASMKLANASHVIVTSEVEQQRYMNCACTELQRKTQRKNLYHSNSWHVVFSLTKYSSEKLGN